MGFSLSRRLKAAFFRSVAFSLSSFIASSWDVISSIAIWFSKVPSLDIRVWSSDFS